MKTNSGLCPRFHHQWWLVVYLTLGLIFDVAIRIFSIDTVIFGNATNIHLVFLNPYLQWSWKSLCKTYCWMIVSRYFAVIRSFEWYLSFDRYFVHLTVILSIWPLFCPFKPLKPIYKTFSPLKEKKEKEKIKKSGFTKSSPMPS